MFLVTNRSAELITGACDVTLWPFQEVALPGEQAVQFMRDRRIHVNTRQVTLSANPKQLGFLGNINVNSGYGGGSIDILRALKLAGYQTSVDPTLGVHTSELHKDVLEQLAARPWVPATRIAHTIPDYFEKSYREGQRTIGWTMWETSAPPDGTKGPFCNWVAAINAYTDALIVPSEHSKEIFERHGAEVPIRVVNYGLDGNEWPYHERVDDGVFRVVLYGDLTSRKAPLEAIEAFQQAFPTQADVEFVIKTHDNQLGMGKIIGIPEFADKRIKVINEFWPREHMRQLLKTADCFLWLSRGEGFGLPPLQAALSGVPVITTRHTGMAEYYNGNYFAGVDADTTSPAPLSGRWFEPNINDAARALRHIYDNQKTSQIVAGKAAQYVRDNFSIETMSRNLGAALEELL